MKTIVLTTAILLATVIGINKSAYAETVKDDTYTVLTQVSNINKIEVHGNVELYLSDGNSDQVKVYNNYYKESALIQDQNGTLCISSYKTEKLVVWVTVNDLRSLAIYDNAEVKSFGKLSAIELDVKLFNNASAQLNMDAFQAYITLNDRAKASLAGNINEGTIKYTHTSVLNTANLLSGNVTKTDVDDVKDNSADIVSL
ncbi:DUF2807 domain-containing protein [Mucilaginibacter sp. BJC16-A38]|uniref:DUF2807 domain-containing protein n=1 Tax=Mucilaginibacter phenanthrenivorans TaxID=1234842 RepID=UPI0021573D7D|nr:DUF2807 domain-containing protein [Mucilaginibacter phenanthrenivorans]MCR8561004.1 DUF2807 domain-containing protein [Mucilaginibacter phenanthrenivorans]